MSAVSSSTPTTTEQLAALAAELRQQSDAADADAAAKALAEARAETAEILVACRDGDLTTASRRRLADLASAAAEAIRAEEIAQAAPGAGGRGLLASWASHYWWSELPQDLAAHHPQAPARAAELAEQERREAESRAAEWQQALQRLRDHAAASRVSLDGDRVRLHHEPVARAQGNWYSADAALSQLPPELQAQCRASDAALRALWTAQAAAEEERELATAALRVRVARLLIGEDAAAGIEEIANAEIVRALRDRLMQGVELRQIPRTWRDRNDPATCEDASAISVAGYRAGARLLTALRESAAQLGQELDAPTTVERTGYERWVRAEDQETAERHWTADYCAKIGEIEVNWLGVILD